MFELVHQSACMSHPVSVNALLCRVQACVNKARSFSTLSDAAPPPLHGLLTMQALAEALAEQLLAIATRLQAAEPMVHSMRWDDFDGTILLNLQQALQVRSGMRRCK